MQKPLSYALFLVLIITLINFLFVFFFNLISNSFSLSFLLENLLFFLASLLSAFLVSAVVIFSTPVLKDFLATYRRYLRFENLSNPLLLRLSKEAPGTYHHSLNVALLTSKAAKAIGADPIVSRLGGYYHDIGKLEDTKYFIENQNSETEQNGLEKLPLQKGAQILKNHIKQGLDLAHKANLPQEVIDLIAQHHGTTLISDFYQKIKERGISADKKNFSYPGPKPLTKEAGILMLADVVESKTHLLNNPAAESLKNEISKIIQERIEDRQLELSSLSKLELAKISDSFLKTILEMRHQRTPYISYKIPKYKSDEISAES